MKEYAGPLDRAKMNTEARYAYEAYCGAKARSKKAGLPPPEPTARQFIAWWLDEKASFIGTVATCGRIDHAKGYSWDNFFMQDIAENSREGATRNNLGPRTRKKIKHRVFVYRKDNNELTGIIPSIRAAATFFKVSQRLIQFLVRGRYQESKLINFNLKLGAAPCP